MIKYCYSKKANNYRGGDYNTGNLGLYNAGILTAITPLTVLKKNGGFDCNNTTHFLISSLGPRFNNIIFGSES